MLGLFSDIHRSWSSYLQLAVLILFWACSGRPAIGQASPVLNEGNNAVYDSSGSTPVKSSSFVDASVFVPANGMDLCGKIFTALSNNSTVAGLVVDARAIPPASLTCTSSETPWVASSGTLSIPPATILLPPGIITISKTWVIPNQTRLIGAGSGTGNTGNTVIHAMSSIGSNILEMGSTSCPNNVPCTGITIENLIVDASATATSNGIANAYAGAGSFIRNVKVYGCVKTGVVISASSGALGASGSGPYVNITVDATPVTSASSLLSCLSLSGTTNTLGIRGLTCLSSDTAASTGISVSASNNLIKDVWINGFNDGIVVSGTISGNVISNVVDTTPAGQQDSTIRITGSGPLVRNLVIMGVRNDCLGGPCHANTIRDETGVAVMTVPNQRVGLYVLGEPTPDAGSGTYAVSRFTSSTSSSVVSNSAPTWIVGSFTGTPSGSCNTGSILSNTSAGTALFVCNSGAWMGVQ